MTDSFLTRCGADSSLIAICEFADPYSIYEKFDIVEGCLEESVGDAQALNWLVSTTSMYTHSLFYEVLENAKNFLLQTIQKILSLVNNYYLNSVNILDKYQEAIIDRLATVKDPIRQETYEYPELKDYPKSLKSTIDGEKDILTLHEKITAGDMTSEAVASKIDILLQRFGKEILGMEPDPYDINGSVKKIVQEKIRGEMVTIDIDRSTLRKYITDIKHYKRDKDEITRAKKAIIDDYEALKRTYSKVTANPIQLAKNDPRVIQNPEREAFIARESRRYADIHVEMMRLFNGYINIYKVAFDTKLAELETKIINHRNTITEIMIRTGLFASLNTKNPDKNRKPIPYNPVNIVK